MLDFYDILTGLGIGVFSLLISSYIVIWYLRKQLKLEDFLLESLDIILNNMNSDENMQKQVYTIGALLGNGIATGSGMKNSLKGGGKLTLNNIIAEIAANWISKAQSNPSPSPLQPTPSPSQLINTRQPSDKW